MSAYSVVDENGQIDTNYLERELRSALAGDIRYKQEDSMKKRACKVARDYDKFKNIVAAAHLKTLTASEVQSLSISSLSPFRYKQDKHSKEESFIFKPLY